MSSYKIYVGSYTGKSAEKLGAGKGICICGFDSVSGDARIRYVMSDCRDPSFLLIRGNLLYAAEELPQSSISAFRIAGDKLEKLESIALMKKDTCHLQVTMDGRYMMASNYGSGSVSVISLTQDGLLKNVEDTLEEPGSSVHPRQNTAHVHSTLLSEDGKRVLSANLGTDTISTYRIDPDDGRLHREQCVSVPPGRGPRHMTFSPEGRLLLVVCELSSSLLVYQYDRCSGIGGLKEEISLTDSEKPQNCKAADLHFSPDGKYLYVSVRGSDRMLLFPYLEEMLGSPKDFSVFGESPRNFCLTPDGNYIMIANEVSGNVAIISRNIETGMPGKLEANLNIPRAVFVTAEVEE